MSYCTSHLNQVLELSPEEGNQVFFAGCILNLQDLRLELAVETDSPENLVLQIFRQWGVEGFARISGSFVAVIYNPEKAQYVLVRDPLGQKSLFYGLGNGRLFVSERVPDVAQNVGREPNPQGWRDYLSLGYMLGDDTAYKRVYRVPPATAVMVDLRGNRSSVRYWTPRLVAQNMDSEEALARVQQALENSVTRVFKTAPKASLMLSGGVDSTLLLALMSRNYLPVCLTAGFEAQEYDEHSIAVANSKRLGCEHRFVQVNYTDIPLVQERLQTREELFGDSSLLPTMKAMELADGGVIVTGSGGDELFGGYRRYRLMLLRQLLGERLTSGVGSLSKLLDIFANGEQRSAVTSLKRLAASYRLFPLDGYATYQRVFRDEEVSEICPWAMRGTASAVERLNEIFNILQGTLSQRCNLLDILTYLPDDGCEKLTLAAPNNTLVLSPLLDMDVVNVAMSLPQKFRFTLFKNKIVLKALLKRIAPELALVQGKKGFGVPVEAWLRKNMRTPDCQLFQKSAVEALQQQHLLGKNPCGARLWTLLMKSEKTAD